MRSGIFVRGRTGLVGLLVLVLTAGPTLPVLGGGRFQRRARSHGSSGSTGGSWGSHGASGGGRVIYTRARPMATHTTFAQRGGTYASHGAAGGSPQSRVVASAQRTAHAYYPNNRVVVRRAPVNVTPTFSNVVNATPMVVSNEQAVKSSAIVPPAPVARVLKRAAYDDTDVSLAGLYPERALALLKSPVSSIARTTTSRHRVMKPTSEVEIPSVLIKKDVEAPIEELPTEDTAPASELPNLDSPTLEATERSVEKVETTRSVSTDSSVDNLSVAVLDDATSLSPVDESESASEAAIAKDELNLEFGEKQPANIDEANLTDDTLELPNEAEVVLEAEVEPDAVEEPVVASDIPTSAESDDNVDLLREATVEPELTDLPTNDSLVGNLDEPTDDQSTVDQPSKEDPTRDLVVDDPTLAQSDQESASLDNESDGEPEQPTAEGTDQPIGLQSILVRHKRRETPQQPKAPESAPKRARLVLHVPGSAEVFLMNRKMVTTGTTRLFNVPVNDPMKVHPYQIRVVTQHGVVVESTQQIRAGQRLELTFNDEAGTLALQPVQVSPFE